MSDAGPEDRATDLVLEFALDAPVEKVWRAIEEPELRAKWLPGRALTAAEPSVPRSGSEARFTLRDDEPPFVETVVTFRVLPAAGGGSVLTIIHGVPAFEARNGGPAAANRNRPPLMRAA